MKVSVIIPTLNSAGTIENALKSIKEQSIPAEIIVVDSMSTDGTAEIAEKYGIVIRQKSNRLSARIIGAINATGDFILNMDSDQFLAKGTLERALKTEKRITVLEEVSVGHGVIAKLNKLDKEIVHRHWKENLDPITGAIKPRFYEKALLLQVYKKIDSLADKLTMYEDAIVYYEAFRLSNSSIHDIGYVEKAIYHLEEDSLIRFMKKWYKYGKTARFLKQTKYDFFLKNRGVRKGNLMEKIGLLPLTLIKGIPYFLGLYLS
ncbi:MAG: glycosyltransferase family 2 protein [Candidatus Aramenus sp.]|jgi:glycosyltransferase involved in cell wall biosynthesis|nr:glycosyltransferase family 2 protein [Candidatus Aramenus sp.]